jgi:hypothetical protein
MGGPPAPGDSSGRRRKQTSLLRPELSPEQREALPPIHSLVIIRVYSWPVFLFMICKDLLDALH